METLIASSCDRFNVLDIVIVRVLPFPISVRHSYIPNFSLYSPILNFEDHGLLILNAAFPYVFNAFVYNWYSFDFSSYTYFFLFFFFLSVSQAQAGVFIFFNRFESEIFLGYSGEYALLLNLFLRLLIAKYNQI